MLLGAFTRLSHAGLGCPDWPGCYGQWLLTDIAKATAVGSAAMPDLLKASIEMVHRYFAALLGLVVSTMAVYGWRLRAQPGIPFRWLFGLLLVVIIQGLFGRWTVTLKLWPQVVTLHLIGALAAFSLLLLIYFSLQASLHRATVAERLPSWLLRVLIVGMILLFVQVLMGGWTSANYAALACPDIPTCHGQWFPSLSLAEGYNVFQVQGPNYLGGMLDSAARISIHVMHRLGALINLIVWLVIAMQLMKKPGWKPLAWLLIIALLTQIGLGIANVLLQLPIQIAMAHHFGAVFLWGVAITVLQRAFQFRLH